MTTSIGAVLRSTGLATIDRALLARAEKPRVKVWAGSIAVGHEKRAKAYTPIRNARQMREMIEAAKLYERQLPLWELTREERDKRELADILASLGEAIEAKERESFASEDTRRRYLY